MCRETKTPTRVTGMNADVQVIQGKGQKYLAFLTALTFHENYDDKEEKKRNYVQLVGERTRSTTEN